MPRDIADVLADLARGLAALESSKEGYEEADEFYTGTDEEVFASEALRRHLQGSINAFPINLAAIPVDTVADRLFISSVTSPDPAVQDAIDTLIANNDFWTWSNDTMRQAQKYGDMYVAVWMGPDDQPIMSPIDPLTTRVMYDSEYERFPLFTIRSWEMEIQPDAQGKKQKICMATLSYTDAIYKFFRKADSKKWEVLETEGEDWPLLNPFKQLPYGHLRNAIPYGRPGHEKSYGTQRLITKNRISLAGNVDFMGMAQRYLLLHPGESPAGGSDLPPLSLADGSTVANTSPRPKPLRMTPGSILEASARDAGEFSATDPQGFINVENSLIADMARAERLPLRLFTDTSGQQPSGDSQRENDKPLRSRVAAAKVNLAAGLVKIFQSALNILGFPNAEVQIEWAQDEITTEKAAYEAADLAVSLVERAIANIALRPMVEHKLAEFGYSADEILTFFGGTVDATVPTGSGEPNLNNPGQGAIPQ